MSEMIKGNLDTIKHSNRIKCFFGVILVGVVIASIMNVKKCFDITSG